MDEALGLAEQRLRLELVEQAEEALGHAAGEPVHEVRPVDKREERALDAHPRADRVPQREVEVGPAGAHLEQAVEQLVGDAEPAPRLGLVVDRAGQAYLLEVGVLLELVVEPVADDVVRRVGDRDVLLDRDAEAQAADGERHANERLDHHVGGETLPLEEGTAQLLFPPLAIGVPAVQRELAVDVHLVPADLVDHDHGPLGREAVQASPEAPLLLLHRQGGGLGGLHGQLADDGAVLARHGALPGPGRIDGRPDGLGEGITLRSARGRGQNASRRARWPPIPCIGTRGAYTGGISPITEDS